MYTRNVFVCMEVRLRIGMYYPFLADWLRVFPMEQVMVVRYEDYIATPSEIINNVCKFLGIRKLLDDLLLLLCLRERNVASLGISEL